MACEALAWLSVSWLGSGSGLGSSWAHLVVSQVEHAQLGLESHEYQWLEGTWHSKYVSKR